MDEEAKTKQQLARDALYLELVSIGWVAAEATLSAVAALSMGSISLSAFSMDSGIELISGMVLVIRMWFQLQMPLHESIAKIERVASIVVGMCLFLLAAYIAVKSGGALAHHEQLKVSRLGLIVAGLGSIITPWLAMKKRYYGQKLGSRALLGDAACSFVCAYMAWTLFIGLLCQFAFHWWWADPLAAVGILYFVIHEAFESFGSEPHSTVHSH